VYPVNPRGCLQVQDDIQRMMNRRELVVSRKDKSVCVIIPEFNILKRLEVTYNGAKPAVTPLVICLPGPLSYTSERAIPYKYDATILEDGKEMPLPPLAYMVNIADNNKLLRSGCILPTVMQRKTSAPIVEQVQAQDPGKGKDVGQSSGNGYSNCDEVLKTIKRSEYKIVDQLLQTPSKIYVLSLLMNLDAHREALMKVLDQAYVDHDVTLGQLGGIVGKITT